MLMDSLSEVELEQQLEIRHIERSGYRDEYDDDDEIFDERIRGFGHKSWE